MRAPVRCGSRCTKHMYTNLKIPSPWSQLALFLMLVGGALVLAVGVVGLIPGVRAGETLKDPGMIKLFKVIPSSILFGLPALTFAKMTFREHQLSALGFRPAGKNIFY